MNRGTIVLAAGSSSRLGAPKQLLLYEGRSLLRRAAEAAALSCQPVVVVLGAKSERLQRELAGLKVFTEFNPTWESGMGSSVQAGMRRLDDVLRRIGAAKLGSVLLTLCDQPLVGPKTLARLIRRFDDRAAADTIAAAAYHDTVGVPVLFGHDYLDDLRALPADGGAKPLLRRHAAKVIPVAMPEAAVDVDTREQYDQLLRRAS